MQVAACAVGRLDRRRWVGFAPALDDGYTIVIGGEGESRRAPADADLLLALAVAYFQDALEDPPEDLAATHADIGALVRHLAAREHDGDRRRLLEETVDAIDDGLAADVVIGRLTSAMTPPSSDDPVGWLVERARAMEGDE